MANRETFETSRVLEYFTEKELTQQIGHGPESWPLILLKELIDNGLDACESAGVPPEIEVEVGKDFFSVRDDGPGIPPETVKRSLNYMVRVSDKAYYVSPTRGQLGNALKCVWAAGFVANGEGRVEVRSRGVHHDIRVGLHQIRREPAVDHRVAEDPSVRNGTILTVRWPEIASFLSDSGILDSYNSVRDGMSLATAFAAFNPHAALVYGSRRFERTAPGWRKWLPSMPSSAHWYEAEHLGNLIAAYLAAEKVVTVREFVANFEGFSGSAKQRVLLEETGLKGSRLSEFVRGGDLDRDAIERLLAALRRGSRPVKARRLGIIGRHHLARFLTGSGCDGGTVEYQCRSVEDANGLPLVLEVAFGVGGDSDGRARIATGINWSPTIDVSFPELPTILAECLVDRDDPVVLVVHLAHPRPAFTDRGKSRIDLRPPEILRTAVERVTKRWKKLKARKRRRERATAREVEEYHRRRRRDSVTIREAASESIERAYSHASSDGRYAANARQIMYAARPLVLELTGGKVWKHSSYFTQVLLPDFLNEHPSLTADWDVVFDNRGKLIEPHTGYRVDLGTIAVREYIRNWDGDDESLGDVPVGIETRLGTKGPGIRYRYALFIEKEGFNEILDQARIARRYDVAIMSTKGMSTTAARSLVEALSRQGVTILVARDFDKSGFTIVHTLANDTRRYEFARRPNVIDLGLRLEDVGEMGLESEPVTYGTTDPHWNLEDCGAAPEEIDFLVTSRDRFSRKWDGRRVELNAMTSERFVAWLEGKFIEHGVEKVIPDEAVLRRVWVRAAKVEAIRNAVERVEEEFDAATVTVPTDLTVRVSRLLEGRKELSWDEAVAALATAGEDEDD